MWFVVSGVSQRMYGTYAQLPALPNNGHIQAVHVPTLKLYNAGNTGTVLSELIFT